MDSRIEELLKKYWDCETSLEEEEQLREYFRGNDIPEPWKETANLFKYFDDQKKQSVKDQFDVTVVDQIKASSPKGKIRGLVQTSLRIAAGVAVLVSAVYFVRQEIRSNNEDPMAMEDTFDDPHEAFEETKKALMMISKGFGRAEQQTKKINLFNEAQDKIQGDTKEKETKL